MSLFIFHRSVIIRVQASTEQTIMKNASTVSIMSLPAELLVEIFRFHNDEVTLWRQTYSWLPITHVCRCWRQLALRHPILWSHIGLGRGRDPEHLYQRIVAMLSRSSNVDLDLDVFNPTQVSQRALRALLLAVPRARTLDFRNVYPFPESVQDMAPADAPRLTSVKIRGENTAHFFAHCRMPLLRKVEWFEWGVPLKLDHPFFRCPLTDLNLRGKFEGPPDFLSVLRGLPLLQSLRLRGSFPQDNEQANTESVLPHLRTLQMDVSMPTWRFLYEHIDTTASACIHFNVTDADPHVRQAPDKLVSTFPVIAAKLRGVAAQICAVSYSCTIYGCVKVAVYTSLPYWLSTAEIEGTWDPHLCVVLEPDFPGSEIILLDLLKLLPLWNANAFYLDVPANILNESPVKQRLASVVRDNLPNVTDVRVIGKIPALLMAELLASPVSPSNGGASFCGQPRTDGWVMPRLETLHISQVRLQIGGRPTWLKTLLSKALVARENAGVGLRCISFWRCPEILEEDLVDLRSLVDRVGWKVMCSRAKED
ncbi:hypothetical protein EIP91_005473 [Steccherinum ochraceum]|uniref:F-box domain-containing protein n=1 Tax=Steccherinum ochraceum TaxID=92696 RepID=A0A4V2MXW8_9APHY|nr:hypothetical protein EIP91_005473 [Steccherinum ochraceum]